MQCQKPNNSGVKKETVQENTKKSQNVQTAVKNVTNNDSTTAVLPQTGVLSDNIFYILGSMICALGVLSLAVAKRRAIRQDKSQMGCDTVLGQTEPVGNILTGSVFFFIGLGCQKLVFFLALVKLHNLRLRFADVVRVSQAPQTRRFRPFCSVAYS